MQRFLESCASYIYEKYHDDLHNICLVFPNRRSGVFFTAYLQKLLKRPVLGPDITTINELLLSLSGLQVPDQLWLISYLYDTYQKKTGSNETFDDFYLWGEMLLADFDDTDKYLVDARDMFRNLAELKEIEQGFDYLTDSQKKALMQFWGSVKNWEERKHQKEFISLWDSLNPVYDEFRSGLASLGLGYGGMVIRDGVERLKDNSTKMPASKYLVIGLNALNECEKKLFRWLQEQGRAEFFWDYDLYYYENGINDAGKFLRENISAFPPPVDFRLDHNSFHNPKNIEIVSVPSSYGQSQVIPTFFDERKLEGISKFDELAIVLADETLLFPVLGAIPDKAGSVNVTMGFPLKHASVMGLVNLVRTLLQNTKVEAGTPVRFYYRPVFDILNHQLLSRTESALVTGQMKKWSAENRIYISSDELRFSPLHEAIFTLPLSISEYPGYFLGILDRLYHSFEDEDRNRMTRELIFHMVEAIDKLKIVMADPAIPDSVILTPSIFFRLLNQYLGQVSVPFEGEPLAGIQVMGILETRCLDFDNLIIIGLNEETWPRAFTAPSFIPFNIRKAFGLPGIDDQDAMYSYYFYRLIQRASNVTAAWNTIREGTTGGELSRYAFQLMLHSPHQVQRRNLDYPFSGKPASSISVPAGTMVSELLLKRNLEGKALSPSAIIQFLTCRLKFYFKYVLQLEEPDEISEEIDRRTFGNLFHKAVENLYHPLTGKVLDQKAFVDLKQDKVAIENAIRRAFATEYFRREENDHSAIDLDGKALLIFSTIRTYLRNMVEIDAENAPLTIHSLESSWYQVLPVEIDGVQRDIKIGGKIDRVDQSGGVVRVIDYKTGNLTSSDLSCNTLEEVFTPQKKKIKKEILQALIYGYILKSESYLHPDIGATIYAILKLQDETFNPVIRINKQPLRMSEVIDESGDYIKMIIRDIYSQDTVFSQTEFRERCDYCPYKGICRK